MRVSPGRAPARQSARKEKTYGAYTFPGPTLGWVSDQNLATAQPGGAFMLENFFPTSTGGILRRGCRRHQDLTTFERVTALTGTVDITEGTSTVTGTLTEFESELEAGDVVRIGDVDYTVDTVSSDTSLTIEEEAEATVSGGTISLIEVPTDTEVKTLFTYSYGGASQLFAATDEQIYNVSIQDTPTEAHTITNGVVSTAQYVTTDGDLYIRGVNGTDTPWVYDGSIFDTTPALTFGEGVTVTASDMIYTWVHKNRFFFIQKESLDAWYLAAGEIGGELAQFSLGGIFPLGGSLVFGSTWSIDAGDGLSSMCIFVTDQGEVAVYAGDNPGEAESWSLVGVYRIGRPMGQQAFIQRGGDIVVATDIGFIAISQALQKDTPSLSPSAMSAPIEAEWNKFVRQRNEKRWAAAVWTPGQMVAVALPTLTNQTPTWLVANARSGRWSVFTGWDANCLAVFNDALYFGSPDGGVFEANTGGSDDEEPYVGVYVPTFDQMGYQGVKTVQMARSVIRSRADVIDRLSVHSDFRVNLPSPPQTAEDETSSVWGTAVWGTDAWGGAGADNIIKDEWRNVTGQGEAISVAIQITSNGTTPLDAEIIRTDVTFTKGEMQV